MNSHLSVFTSKALTAMRLDDLVGCGFPVVEVLSEDCIKNHGALVLLKEPYLGDHPYVDIKYSEYLQIVMK